MPNMRWDQPCGFVVVVAAVAGHDARANRTVWAASMQLLRALRGVQKSGAQRANERPVGKVTAWLDGYQYIDGYPEPWHMFTSLAVERPKWSCPGRPRSSQCR